LPAVAPAARSVAAVPQDIPRNRADRARREIERAMEQARRELDRLRVEERLDRDGIERLMRESERYLREIDRTDFERLDREAREMTRELRDEFGRYWQDPPPVPPLPDIEIPDLDLLELELMMLEMPELPQIPPLPDIEIPELDLLEFELQAQEMALAMQGHALELQEMEFQDYETAIDFDHDFEFAMDFAEEIAFDFAEDLDFARPFSPIRRGGLLTLLEMTWQDPQDPGVERFNEAKNLLFDGQYQEALERFRQVVEQYARSAYVDDAAFWASYALEQMRGHYEEAFSAYQEFITAYAESPFVEHARANMVRLAGRLYQQGMEQYKQFIEDARGDEEDEIRLYALHALVQQEGEDAVNLIEGVLSDGSGSSRLKREAIDMLRRLEDPGAVQLLERTARQHADPEVRRRAISGLGSRPDRSGFDALTRIYPSEQSVNARRYIADAAGNYRRAEFAADAAAFLARVAENDADSDVRRTAIGELKNFSDEIAMPHLRRLLERVSDGTVTRYLLSAIADSDDPANIPLLRSQITRSSDEGLQRAAVEYIGSIEGPEALDALIEIADGDYSEAVRTEAVDEIGDFEGSRATNALIGIARSNAPERVRREALDELGNRRTSESFSAVSAIATGGDDVRLRARAIAELRGWGAEAAPVLERIVLTDAESDLRRGAVSALGNLEEGAGWEALVTIYNTSEDTRIRSGALDYLWRINEENSLDTVIAAARADADSDVRRHAVQMLGRSENERARAALRELLNIPPREED